MFRYNFVPLKSVNGTLDIALADPRNLNTIDELGLLLNKKLRVKVATASQIADLLKKTEQSQRVLEEVTEGFTLDVVGDDDNPDETLSIDKLSQGDSDIAPVIKLVDTTIFNALERRASPISTSNRATRKSPLSTASMASCTTPCRPSRRTGKPPFFPASR